MSSTLCLANGGVLLVAEAKVLELTTAETLIGRTAITDLDGLAAKIWEDWAKGQITDDAAERLQAAIQRRRASTATRVAGTAKKAAYDAVKRSTRRANNADKVMRAEKRRRVAHCGALPGYLAQSFTTAENAAIAIIIAQIRAKGFCDLFIACIAARAGCCDRVVQNAIQHAERLGLIKIQRRARKGQANLSNIISLLDTDLKTWVARGNTHKQLHWVNESAGNRYKILETTEIGDKKARIEHDRHAVGLLDSSVRGRRETGKRYAVA